MPPRSHTLIARAVRGLVLPTTYWRCIIGAASVLGLCLGVLHIRTHLPVEATPLLAVGIPLLGSAGILYYFFRLVYYVDTEE